MQSVPVRAICNRTSSRFRHVFRSPTFMNFRYHQIVRVADQDRIPQVRSGAFPRIVGLQVCGIERNPDILSVRDEAEVDAERQFELKPCPEVLETKAQCKANGECQVLDGPLIARDVEGQIDT